MVFVGYGNPTYEEYWCHVGRVSIRSVFYSKTNVTCQIIEDFIFRILFISLLLLQIIDYPFSKRTKILFNTLNSVRDIKPFDLTAYCLLHEHLHLLLGIGEESKYNVTDIMHSLKRNFTINYKKSYKITHGLNLWQKRFWDHIIRDEDDFKKHLDYIHYNPVKHGLTLKPEEYKYSSFNRWMKNGFYEEGWGHSEPDDLKNIELE